MPCCRLNPPAAETGYRRPDTAGAWSARRAFVGLRQLTSTGAPQEGSRLWGNDIPTGRQAKVRSAWTDPDAPPEDRNSTGLSPYRLALRGSTISKIAPEPGACSCWGVPFPSVPSEAETEAETADGANALPRHEYPDLLFLVRRPPRRHPEPPRTWHSPTRGGRSRRPRRCRGLP